MYGSEKRYVENNLLKKIAYTLFGELHVPGRLRAYHVIKKIEEIGLNKKKGLRMLDAGSGRGDLVVCFAKNNSSWEITGVEIDAERLKIARETQSKDNLKNVNFIGKNLLDEDIAGKFDLITCCDVLEHIDDDVSVMEKFHQLLDNNGVLLLTFPSIPQRTHLKLVSWREKKIGFKNEDYGHVRDGYSVAGISKTLKEIGFQNIDCRYTFGFWGTLCFDLFFIIGDNRPNPIIFFLTFPALMMLAFLDLHFPSKQGSALLVTARK